MSNDPGTKKLLLKGAKDLARQHELLFAKEGIDIDLFHNNTIQYSSIQLSRYQGTPEWTALGDSAVKALEIWFDLFQKNTHAPLQNTISIRENYAPEFLTYQKRYSIKPLLINDDLAKALNGITDRFARFDRLEKYLFGNLQRFFNHIDYEHNKNVNFLKINVISLKNYDRSLEVYHQQRKTAFHAVFKCNFRLPQTLRLGQSTALGYGTVYHL